jgi:hypothetical protein
MKEITPCPEWEKQLSCTHPEDLSSVEQIALKTHVARCTACAHARAYYLETDDLLRSLPPIEPLPSLPTLIQHRRKGKDARVVDSRFPLSVTTRTAARHTELRQQPYLYEALNPLVVTPSTTEVADTAGQSSSQPLLKQLSSDRYPRKRSLIPVLVALLLIVGTGASFWGFTTIGRNYVATPATATLQHPTVSPTGHPSVTTTPTFTTSPYPPLAASYAGTIVDLQANVPSRMTLSNMQQNDGHISGSIDALHLRGTFSGLLDTSKHLIYFIETASSGHAPLSFTGTVKADGELGGSFCAIDQSGQCIPDGIFGLWSVAPRITP